MEATTGGGETRRRRLLTGVILVSLTALVVVAFAAISGSEGTATFCTADGVIGHPGAYRDHSRNCIWVDEDGNPIPELAGR